jgi:hypothetical protein
MGEGFPWNAGSQLEEAEGHTMKTWARIALVAVFVLGMGGSAFASHCPLMIKEANEKMSKMDQGSETVKTAKALVEEADRLHKAGNHAESEKRADEALALLK